MRSAFEPDREAAKTGQVPARGLSEDGIAYNLTPEEQKHEEELLQQKGPPIEPPDSGCALSSAGQRPDDNDHAMSASVKRSMAENDPLTHRHAEETPIISSGESSSDSELAETPNADAIIASGGDQTAIDTAVDKPKQIKQPKQKKGRKK